MSNGIEGVATISRSKGRALDFFTGTGSVAKQLRKVGYEVITLDINVRRNPDICTDIYFAFPPTSPECVHHAT